MAIPNVRMFPPPDGTHGTTAAPTKVVGGRTYGAALGAVADVPVHDAGILDGAGWTPVIPGATVGPTSARPGNPLRQDGLGPPPAGTVFIDTTLSAVVAFDGSTWRNVLTGAAA